MDLQAIWYFLWVLLWAVYFATDGFDLGIGVLLPFLGKNDEEKRIMYNAIGPLWDGNEVWLITAGGVTFAAFPLMYAVMFSSLYSALMLILFALIIRGVSFEFRGKINSPGWKKLWDFCLFIGSLVPSFLFGVAFANIFQGIPIDDKGVYHGTLFTLLNPYAILGAPYSSSCSSSMVPSGSPLKAMATLTNARQEPQAGSGRFCLSSPSHS